jgi:hypothetical protein
MARTVAAKKRVVRRDWTRADVKELRQHSKAKRLSKLSLVHLSVAQVPSDKRPACSESRSATAALKQGEREEVDPKKEGWRKIRPDTLRHQRRRYRLNSCGGHLLKQTLMPRLTA